MKTKAFIKPLLFSALLAGSLSFQSCNKCNRDKNSDSEEMYDNGTDTVNGVMDDTINDTIGTDNGSGMNSTGNRTYNSGASTTGNATGTTTAQSNSSTNESSGYGGKNDKVVNSRSKAYDENGKPTDGGGSMGSGMGTGTGSTGNNSKVTDPKDQYN